MGPIISSLVQVHLSVFVCTQEHARYMRERDRKGAKERKSVSLSPVSAVIFLTGQGDLLHDTIKKIVVPGVSEFMSSVKAERV